MGRLNNKESEFIADFIKRYNKLETISDGIENAYLIMKDCYLNGGKLIIAGNGGSCADSEHIVGELMKSFKLPRPIDKSLEQKLVQTDPKRGQYLSGILESPLTAVSLTCSTALISAYTNDAAADAVYAQQVLGMGKPNDVFIGITTSGNSENILNAAVTAKAMGLRVIGLTGKDGGKLAPLCDAAVIVPENETYKIQEFHLPLYHLWCMMLEDNFFG